MADTQDNPLEIRAQESDTNSIRKVMNVNLPVQVVLGEVAVPISSIINMTKGTVLELNKKIGEPVSIVIHGEEIARGELVKMGDDRMGVSLTEVIKEYKSSL